MAISASVQNHARDTQTAPRHEGRAETRFKPLALPALAAAVEMSRRDIRRPVAERQVPAILRVEALTD